MIKIKNNDAPVERKDPKAKDNSKFRDYKIIFKSKGEEQRYFGSVRALLHTFPDAEIISVTKLKKNVN